ncbi:hypothetical protein THAOC_27941 [Thalassiosira oceanica]|uniref:Uncharacterized protein n=1 Tax=Thalassiosira oceanica TaxID=159749 RepID=K0RVB6_THAOC|nr:hypothetical protein THAOC_27941 [Thalassiosira oceanica]|eukprot:EJK52756.1 hypothetical protein THAOC_27941 [Thalassiosira oceanica]
MPSSSRRPPDADLERYVQRRHGRARPRRAGVLPVAALILGGPLVVAVLFVSSVLRSLGRSSRRRRRERNSLTSPGSRRRIDRRPSEDAAAEDDPDAEDCARPRTTPWKTTAIVFGAASSPLQGYVP